MAIGHVVGELLKCLWKPNSVDVKGVIGKMSYLKCLEESRTNGKDC